MEGVFKKVRKSMFRSPTFIALKKSSNENTDVGGTNFVVLHFLMPFNVTLVLEVCPSTMFD